MHFKKLFFVLLLFYPVISHSDENIGKSKVFVEKLGKQVVEKVSNTEIQNKKDIIILKNSISPPSTTTIFQDLFLEDIGKQSIKEFKSNLLIHLIIILSQLMHQNLRGGKELSKQLNRFLKIIITM